MHLKKLFLAVGLALTAVSSWAYTDFAQITNVTPEYDEIRIPQQECWSREAPRAERERSGAVVGGVLGALAGRNVGRGTGKEVATVAGAIGGALLGDHVQNDMPREQRECRTYEKVEQRLVGYRIDYVYAGRQYSLRMPEAPQGTRLPVNIEVTPEFRHY